MKLFLSGSFAPLRRFCLVFGALAIVLMAFGAFAQEDENRHLDNVKASLEQIEKELAAGAFDDPALVEIQARLDAARGEVAKVTNALGPRAQSIQSRLDQLGAPPAEGQPPESPELTQERKAQAEARTPIDEVLKRASVLNIQADQLTENVSQKRRDLFATRVLARTHSLLSPGLWMNVADEAPRRLTAVLNLFAEWRDRFAERMWDQRGVLLFGAVVLALFIVWPLRKWVQRFGQLYFADTVPATRLRRSAAAIWVVLIVTAAPIAAAVLVYLGLTLPGFVPERAMPFVGKLVKIVAFASFISGLTRGILAPGRPSWRLPDISDETVARLAPYPIWIAIVFALAHTVLALLDVTGVGLSTVMAIDGVAATSIALVFALALRPAKAASQEAEQRDSPAHRDEYWLHSAVRLATWTTVVVVLIAGVLGYISFAFFLATQMLWIGVLGGTLYILLALTDDLLCGWEPGSGVVRFASGTVGLKQGSFEQLCVLASGIVRLILIVMAVMLAAAPWGVQSGDVAGWIARAFSGITLGGFSLSLTAVLGAFALLVAGILLTRAVQNWLDKSYLPRTRIDDGLKNSIRTATGYAGVLLASGLAVSSLGFGLDRLAIVAGALSVGIGFGLQSVVSNFVSGLILLAERPIKVGDWIGVGTDEGNVRRISVRSTVIELFDRSTLIVPNSDLITKPVRNRTHQNPTGVVQLLLGTGHETDVEEVKAVLLKAASGISAIVQNPAPEVLITGTTDLGIQWQFRCTVPTPRQVATTRSELYFAVLKDFQAKNIKITASPAT
jgi:small-conductance mechanosensitive channel